MKAQPPQRPVWNVTNLFDPVNIPGEQWHIYLQSAHTHVFCELTWTDGWININFRGAFVNASMPMHDQFDEKWAQAAVVAIATLAWPDGNVTTFTEEEPELPEYDPLSF